MTGAERIVAAEIRKARAEGFRAFGRHFGNVAAALIIGVALGLFAAWVIWVFWFAAVETWTFLASPIFIAVAELVAIGSILWARKLFRRIPPE